MNPSEEIQGILHTLGLTPQMRGWVLGGSGVLAMRDIRPIGSDVDLFLNAYSWDRLAHGRVSGLGTEIDGRTWDWMEPHPNDPPFLRSSVLTDRVNPALTAVNIDAFFAWSNRGHALDVLWCLRNPEFVLGWPCVPLHYIYYLKMLVGRTDPDPKAGQKHRRDLKLINDYQDRLARHAGHTDLGQILALANDPRQRPQLDADGRACDNPGEATS